MELNEILTGSRGKVASEIRAGRNTVREIAEALDMSVNNVRAHIASLQRDGIVARSGSRAGFRKPTLTYALTDNAETLLARAYEPVLVELSAVLAERGGEMRPVFQEVGNRLAAGLGSLGDLPLRARLDVLAAAFRRLGGSPEVEIVGDTLTVRGDRCPLARLVAVAPEACEVARALIVTAAGVEVEEHCTHGPQPACCFRARLAG